MSDDESSDTLRNTQNIGSDANTKKKIDEDNPFQIPSNEEVFIKREEEKRRKLLEKEQNKHLPIHQKHTWSTKLTVSRVKDDDDKITVAPESNDKLIKKINYQKDKENIGEYIEKKKQMFLLQMGLDTKKFEIKKLDQKIAEREKKLQQEELALKRDEQRFDDFLAENDIKASDAVNLANKVTKEKESAKKEVQKLSSKIAVLSNEISKLDDQLENCTRYKNFLEKLTPQEWIQQIQDSKQLDDADMYFKTPEQLLNIFADMEEQNLILIQNSHQIEEQLENNKKEYRRIKEEKDGQIANLTQQVRSLTRQIEEEKMKIDILKAKDTLPSDVNNNQMLQKLTDILKEIYLESVATETNTTLKPLQMLTEIELKLESLLSVISKLDDDFVQKHEKAQEKIRRKKKFEQRSSQFMTNSEKLKDSAKRTTSTTTTTNIVRKSSKPLMFRSVPVDKKKKQDNDKKLALNTNQQKNEFDEFINAEICFQTTLLPCPQQPQQCYTAALVFNEKGQLIDMIDSNAPRGTKGLIKYYAQQQQRHPTSLEQNQLQQHSDSASHNLLLKTKSKEVFLVYLEQLNQTSLIEDPSSSQSFRSTQQQQANEEEEEEQGKNSHSRMESQTSLAEGDYSSSVFSQKENSFLNEPSTTKSFRFTNTAFQKESKSTEQAQIILFVTLFYTPTCSSNKSMERDSQVSVLRNDLEYQKEIEEQEAENELLFAKENLKSNSSNVAGGSDEKWTFDDTFSLNSFSENMEPSILKTFKWTLSPQTVTDTQDSWNCKITCILQKDPRDNFWSTVDRTSFGNTTYLIHQHYTELLPQLPSLLESFKCNVSNQTNWLMEGFFLKRNHSLVWNETDMEHLDIQFYWTIIGRRFNIDLGIVCFDSSGKPIDYLYHDKTLTYDTAMQHMLANSTSTTEEGEQCSVVKVNWSQFSKHIHSFIVTTSIYSKNMNYMRVKDSKCVFLKNGKTQMAQFKLRESFNQSQIWFLMKRIAKQQWIMTMIDKPMDGHSFIDLLPFVKENYIPKDLTGQQYTSPLVTGPLQVPQQLVLTHENFNLEEVDLFLFDDCAYFCGKKSVKLSPQSEYNPLTPETSLFLQFKPGVSHVVVVLQSNQFSAKSAIHILDPLHHTETATMILTDSLQSSSTQQSGISSKTSQKQQFHIPFRLKIDKANSKVELIPVQQFVNRQTDVEMVQFFKLQFYAALVKNRPAPVVVEPGKFYSLDKICKEVTFGISIAGLENVNLQFSASILDLFQNLLKKVDAAVPYASTDDSKVFCELFSKSNGLDVLGENDLMQLKVSLLKENLPYRNVVLEAIVPQAPELPKDTKLLIKTYNSETSRELCRMLIPLQKVAARCFAVLCKPPNQNFWRLYCVDYSKLTSNVPARVLPHKVKEIAISIKKCKELLPRPDQNSTPSDPVVKVFFRNQKKVLFKTKILHKTCNPVFEETSPSIKTVDIEDPQIEVKVFDHKGTLKGEECIGQRVINLSQVQSGSHWYYLNSPGLANDVSYGEIELEIDFKEVDA